ncbi:MAG TPA: 7-cyano-7-deazaguanine synthase QueC [Acidobacteriota bacterium]|nr:7-cyano-7-deazaguanine synthase QueC [Acidobacteriota bacterium]
MTGDSPAVVLLSGGLDSAVVLAICRTEGFRPCALTIDYGQRNRLELEGATQISDALGAEQHIVLKIDLTQWGGSALTGGHEVPTGRAIEEMAHSIPITYVPARNTIFLSVAMAWAETLGTGHVYIGAHALDYSGYPDCRPEYFRAFEQMANLATRSGVEENTTWQIHTPLLRMTKQQIVRRGVALAVPFEHTHSCYQPTRDGLACGVCDACLLRLAAFAAVGIPDPIHYRQDGTTSS